MACTMPPSPTSAATRRSPSKKSDGIEAGLRYNGSDFAGSITGYAVNFGNFITAVPMGEVIEDLPVYQYPGTSGFVPIAARDVRLAAKISY